MSQAQVPVVSLRAAAVWGTSFLLIRMWTRAQLAAPAPAEPSLAAELSPARSEG